MRESLIGGMFMTADPHRTYTPAEVEEAKLSATHQDWINSVKAQQAANQRSGWTPRRRRTGY